MEAPQHIPVMLPEVLSALDLKPGMLVVDGTVGLAGHASAMAALVAPGGALVGLDWDEAMLARAREKLEGCAGIEFRLFHTDYRELPEMVAEACKQLGRKPEADAILLDLGLNSAQIDDPERGFSFMAPGPLDMRMDRSRGEPASALLNRIGAGELERLLMDYGDEHWARKIAQIVVDRRKQKPLRTTEDLVDCVMAAIPAAKREKRIHPATRTFQAVRVAVNRELLGLTEALRSAARCLAPGGTMVVLAYHSGEDRAAKTAFRELSRGEGFVELYKKPLRPEESEVAQNPKSRSAKLRALRKESHS